MPESVTRLWSWITTSASQLSTGELILRTALICCSLFAVVQLLSMLATHYGDNNATSKSFFLSLLLHCCFALGWATAVDGLPKAAVATGDPEKPAVPITLVPADDPTTEPGNSTRAVWDSSTKPFESELTRVERRESEPLDLPMPTMEKGPDMEPLVPDAPDLPAEPDLPAPTPTPQSVAMSASTPARSAAELEPLIQQSRAETRAVPATRQQLSREASAVDLATRVEPQRGAAERVAPANDDAAMLPLANEQPYEVEIPKVAGPPDESIRRRSNPSPVAADVLENGSSPASTAATTTGNRSSERFTRSGNRTGSAVELDPNLPAKSNSTVTSSTTAAREQVVASRITVGTEAPGTNPSPSPEPVRPRNSMSTSRTPTRDPETYRSRRFEQRKRNALKNGGSEESERAVEASLRWMAGLQEPTGHWSSAKHGGGVAKQDPQGNNRLDGGLHADSGITGLVVLSYLGAGYTHEEGKYSDVVQRALKWLIAQQHPNGYLGGTAASRYDRMYCHAMATFALAEAYGMQNDPNSFPELRDAVRKGVELICEFQNADGGWRYGKGTESDMSMFGWQLMALKSAVNAGIAIPEETRRGMTKFLQSRARGTRGGLAGYKLTDPPSPAMTAEALFCRQMFGAKQRDGASLEAVSYLRQNLPRLASYDEYYWYYGTLAMFQQDGEPWAEWNGALRDMLIAQQRTQGPLAGSWDPKGKWAGIGGRLYSTAVSTMCLEVYYRFLRIYQSGEE